MVTSFGSVGHRLQSQPLSSTVMALDTVRLNFSPPQWVYAVFHCSVKWHVWVTNESIFSFIPESDFLSPSSPCL